MLKYSVKVAEKDSKGQQNDSVMWIINLSKVF